MPVSAPPLPVPEAAPAAGRAVRLAGVDRHYGRGDGAVAALDGVTMAVEAGEFLALMGPSGSGKSTLLNLVGALDQATAGTIEVGGRDIGRLSPREAARYRRREVGFVFQSFNLLPRLTVLENVAMPLMFEGVASAERLRRAGEVLGELGLAGRREHRPGTLSGGEKQRVAIARALVNRPLLLLADEPTGNLDSRNAATAMELLGQLNRDRGQTIILITHDAEVAGHATRILHMRDGRIVGTAPRIEPEG
ncbi:MAG TPA: ABC transporter ATP-binding protein [Candidatus Dormibacteraeota bacterium]|jgi:putative ABC transport system ATP-binding protein|nr:ABC transporter ATP-binding protein [Candidatus Dormibacteraeota bacterium]